MAQQKVKLEVWARNYTLPQAREAVQTIATAHHVDTVREGKHVSAFSNNNLPHWVFFLWGDNLQERIPLNNRLIT